MAIQATKHRSLGTAVYDDKNASPKGYPAEKIIKTTNRIGFLVMAIQVRP